MKQYYLVVFFFAFTATSLGQATPELNHWFFGHFAGLDFSSGAPVAVENSLLYSDEGSASVSDSAGNLLFYTNGTVVWNRLHETMQNGTGLMSDISSTQSALIVQRPCYKGRYYIFTTPSFAPIGLYYSEVDMELDGGSGGVTSVKNVPLATPVAEKLAVVWHADEQRLWLICREAGSNRFFSYAITAEGINPVPVISSAGSNETVGVGYLKATLDGNTLVSVNFWGVDVLSFDRTTGIVSSKFYLPNDLLNFENPYGTEFSPNGDLLYVTTGMTTIYQFDLTLPTSAEVGTSVTTIGNYAPVEEPIAYALQLGPDGKIYVCEQNQSSLGCIANPNTPGVGCGFTAGAVPIDGTCNFGLPSFQMRYQYTFNDCPPIPPPPIDIPNIITPNGDGTNDAFLIGNTVPGQVALTICNRWGNTVFSSSAYMNDWTGEALSEGVYFYHVHDPERAETYTGFVEVIR